MTLKEVQRKWWPYAGFSVAASGIALRVGGYLSEWATLVMVAIGMGMLRPDPVIAIVDKIFSRKPDEPPTG